MIIMMTLYNVYNMQRIVSGEVYNVSKIKIKTGTLIREISRRNQFIFMVHEYLMYALKVEYEQ